jgi:hypothetical protein
MFFSASEVLNIISSFSKIVSPKNFKLQTIQLSVVVVGGAVLSPYVSVQVPRYLLVPGTAATLAYCTDPDDR